jgi:hypothetical protein
MSNRGSLDESDARTSLSRAFAKISAAQSGRIRETEKRVGKQSKLCLAVVFTTLMFFVCPDTSTRHLMRY